MRLAYQNMVAAKGYEIVAIVDRDVCKQGTDFFGTPIISPEELVKLDAELEKYDCVITIRTAHVVDEVKQWLKKMKNAEVYTYEDFFIKEKLNGNLYRISMIQTHMVDHCNLNCVRCTHFSPLVKKDGKEFYLNPDEFERDVKRIAELTEGDVDEYQLAGGEPLLHPECYKFPYIIKKYLPHTDIKIITNGTLVDCVDEKFYQSCRDNKVQIWVTRYPVNVDYDGIVKNLRERGLDAIFSNPGNSEEELKEMWGTALHLEGGLDGDSNFEGCPVRCFMLRNGYISVCALGAFSDLFNNYFGTYLPMPIENGINIHEVSSLKEVTDFLAQKIPLCEYCRSLERMAPIPWAVSERKMEEWTDGCEKKQIGY
jgi:hypothetical protein